MPDPTPIPVSQAPQQMDPQSIAEYMKAQAAQQANTTGLTQMGPQLNPTAPIQRTFDKAGPQQVSAFGVGERGAHQRESMQNLVKAAQGLANKFGEQQQAKQNREYEQVVGRFMGATQGVAQAQAQVVQATGVLQDPQATPAQKQAAQQQLQAGQDALKQNQTILNDMSQDKKAHKVITKAFGVDDKNAASPERAAAIAALKKQGMSQMSAQVQSQLPQTMQLSPQAQAQQMARQAGVVGAPATGGQLLAAAGKAVDQQIKRGIATDRLVPLLAKAGLVIATNEDGSPQTNEDGSTKIIPMTPEQRALNPALKAQDDWNASQEEMNKAKINLATDPNNPQNQARMMNAKAHAEQAQAAMIHAQKYRPGGSSTGTAEGMDNLVDMFHKGELDPSQIPGFGKSRTEFLEALHKKYPDDNPAQASEDYKFAGNVGVQLVLKGLDNLVGLDGKSGNLQEVVKSSNGIKRTDFPAINDMEAWARINKGDPKMASYYAQVLEVSDQLAKILQGGGTGSGTSDAKLKQAQSILNSGFSKNQIIGIVEGLSPLLANRRSSMIGSNRYLKNQYGTPSGGSSDDGDVIVVKPEDMH